MTIEQKKTVCTYCSMGCGVSFGVEDNNVNGIAYDMEHPVNKGSLCPRGHYIFDLLNHPARLSSPMINMGKKFMPTSWEAAAGEVKACMEKASGDEIGIIVNGNSSLEDLYAAAKFAESLKTSNLEITDVYPDENVEGAKNASFDEIAKMDTLVILGDVLTKAPCFSKYIDAVKYAKKGNQIVVIDTAKSRTSWFATKFIKVHASSKDELNAALKQAEQILAKSGSGAVITSSSVDDPTIEAAGKALAARTNKKFLGLHYTGNAVGARKILNSFKTANVKQALLDGNLKVLILLGASLDADALEAAKKINCLVVADVLDTDAALAAHIVLPVATHAEALGTFVSCNETVNHLKPVAKAYGQSKTYAEILSGLTKADLTLGNVNKLLKAQPKATSKGSLDKLMQPREENILHTWDAIISKRMAWAKNNG